MKRVPEQKKKFLIHLARCFFFSFMFLYETTFGVKNIHSHHGPFWGCDYIRNTYFLLTTSILLCSPIFHSFYFSTFIKPHKLNKLTQLHVHVHMETSKPTRRWKISELFIFSLHKASSLYAFASFVSCKRLR